MKKFLIFFAIILFSSILVGCNRCRMYYTPVDEAKSMGIKIEKDSIVTYQYRSSGETFDAVIYQKCK